MMASPQTAYASNPTTINFQGKVTNANGTNEASGSVSRTLVFRLYNNVNISSYNPNSSSCASDSNCVWEESDTLTVTDGVFQVELGTVCPFFTSNSCNKSTPIDFNSLNSLSMTMKFNSDAAGFMTPLWHLQSVPYAFNADRLGGLAKTDFGQLAANNTWSGTNLINSSSTTAFQIQNASGASLLSVDTQTTSNLFSNSNFETNVNGWTPKNGATVTRSTAAAYVGQASMKVDASASLDGSKYSLTLAPNTSYTMSGYFRAVSGTADIQFGRQDNGSDINSAFSYSINNTWAYFVDKFTTGSTISGSNVYIRSTDGNDFYADAIQLEVGSQSTAYNPGGTISLSAPVNGVVGFNGSVLIGNNPTSTTAGENIALTVSKTSATAQAITSQITLSPDSSGSDFGIGINNLTDTDINNSNNFDSVTGIVNNVYKSGSATANDAVGIKSFVANEGGTTTNLKGQLISVGVDAGTVQNAYGLYVDSAYNNATLTNNYGLYVGDQSGVGSGDNYNIYSLGASSENLFEGAVSIGNGLTVNGQALFQNAGGDALLKVDASGNNVALGKKGTGGINGSLVFNTTNASNTSITISAASTGTSYSLTLPTTGPSTSQCLQSDNVTASQLVFGACSSGSGDNITVNGSAATDANFIDVAASGTVTGTTWSLNTGATPNQVSLNVSNASGSQAGSVTTGTQTLAGDKTFTGATTFAPTGNNVGTTIKQTSGTATSGNILDVQTINGSSHFITVANSAANEGAVTLQSIGATRDLTLDSGSGTIKLGSNSTTIQKAATAFTLDINNASDSTLTVTNAGSGVASLSVEGDVAAGSGRVFKVGATSGSTISACGANNYVSSFAATGGLVSGGSCSTISSSNLSDSSNLALLNAANTFAPTANNSGTTIKQTSGTATSGNVLDIQTANGSSHFITVANSAANEGAVTVQSIGATRDLTLDSSSGTVKLGSNATALQKAGSAFTLDLSNGSSNSTLTVSNTGGAGNVVLNLDSGGNYAVGGTNGVGIGACSAGQYVSSFTSVGGIVTAGSCTAVNTQTTLAQSYTNGSSSADQTILLTSADGGGILIQDAASTVGTLFSVQNSGGTANYLNITNSTITFEDSGATHRTAISIDLTNHALKVYSADGTTNFASISATNTDATFKSNTGTTKIGSGTGAVTITAGSGSAVNITGDANSTWQTTSGTLTVQSATSLSLLSGTSNSVTLDSGSSGNINIGTGATGKAVAVGNSQSGTTVTQTAGAVTNTLSNTGNTVQTNTNSATAFNVKNSSGSSLFNIDSSSSTGNNLVANSSFETAVSNWSAVNAGTASQDSTQFYEGTKSLKIVTGTNGSGGGASYSTGGSFLSSSTVYTLSAYVKTDSTLFVNTLEMGRMDNGSSTSSCLTAQTVTQGWTRFSCTFTTGTVSGSPNIYFKQTDAINRNFYIEDIQLQTDANATTNYRNGTLGVTGSVVNGSLVLQGASNSSTAFQVQNSSGSTVLNVDTTDSNLISNPGFEANATGWTASGTGSIRRETAQTYLGQASLKVVSQAAANSGAQFSLNPVVTKASTTYTISWYAKLDGASSAFTDMIARYSPDGSATSDCSVTAINSGTVVTGGWTRYYCAVSSATTPSTSGFIRIMQTGTTAHTYYVDAVQLEESTVANMTAYGAGTISINGIVNTPSVFKNISDSVSAFQVQSASGASILNIDSLNLSMRVGTSTDNVTFTAATYEPVLNGNARHTRRITVTPEYAGGSMTGDGSNNSGTMTSDNDTSSPFRNFYNWTVSGGTSNDYDIYVRVPIPSDFAEFTSSDAFTIEGYTSNTANTALDLINIYDNGGTGRCTSSVSFEPGSNSTWADTTSNQTCTDTGVAAANDIWTVRIRLTASNSANARVGRFYISYLSKW